MADDFDDAIINVDVDESTKILLRNKDFYVNQGSVFMPNSRIRINFVPIVLNVVLPWVLFVFLLTITVFRWRHDHEYLNDIVWWLMGVTLAAMYGVSLFKDLHNIEAKWTRASACYVLVALLAALISSFFLYKLFFRQYYDIMDLKTYPLLDVSQTQGKDVMDGGMFYFSQGTQIDFSRSWHFKHRDTFCVAPLVRKDLNGKTIVPSSGSLDFFVVGKNCCSVSSSDYRCPGYDSETARAGIRILHGDKLSFFRLAVQQGETQYGYISTYPIFVEWVEDPVYAMEDLKSKGMASYFILIFASSVWQTLLVCMCTVRFSLIGRRKKDTPAT